jgi:hypothetical protein
MPRGNGYRAQVDTEAIYTRVSELNLTGKTQRQIAAIITEEFRQPGEKEYTQQAVCFVIKRIRKEWRKARIDKFEQKLDRELARIDQIHYEAWAAWQRSIGEVKKTVKEKKAGSGADSARITETTEVQAGDPRFLQIMQECIKKRSELLALNPSQKMELTGPVTITVKYEDMKQADANA